MSDGVEGYSEIVETVRAYVEGMTQADAEKLRRAMYPRACSIGNFEGALEWDDREAFIAGVEAAVETPEADPQWRILSISVEGDVACVQVEDVYLGIEFLDLLTLLRRDGEWKIAAKVFHHRVGR